jgi:hypothetical protein
MVLFNEFQQIFNALIYSPRENGYHIEERRNADRSIDQHVHARATANPMQFMVIYNVDGAHFESVQWNGTFVHRNLADFINSMQQHPATIKIGAITKPLEEFEHFDDKAAYIAQYNQIKNAATYNALIRQMQAHPTDFSWVDPAWLGRDLVVSSAVRRQIIEAIDAHPLDKRKLSAYVKAAAAASVKNGARIRKEKSLLAIIQDNAAHFQGNPNFSWINPAWLKEGEYTEEERHDILAAIEGHKKDKTWTDYLKKNKN